MTEYIEREKAIAICQSYYEYCLKMHNFSGDSVAYDIRSNIQGLSTADVVEVKHGEWIENEDDFWVMCSVCGTERYDDEEEAIDCFSYCPYCGAKMDKKEGAEE